MYYSAIGALAILILLIENRDVFLNHKGAFETPVWRVYRRFLFAVLVYYLSDVAWGLLESHKLSALLFADTTVYFVAVAVGVLFWAEYTVAYLEEKNAFARFLILAGRVLAGLISLIALVNIFTPVLFAVDADCVYSALPMRYVMLDFQIVLLLLISTHAFISMRRLPAEKRQRYRALICFGLIMALFLGIQLWFPYLPLYTIAYMLGTCLLHAFVVSDEKAEYKRGLEEAEKIRALKETIASLLDNMPGMTFTKDAETGVYLACNQAFAEYAHKTSPDGVAGLTDAQIFDAETAAHFVEDDRMALSMDAPYIFFEDVSDAAGNQRQLQTTKIKYTDANGRLCVLGMCQDVTDIVRIRRENATTKEAYEKARSTGIIYTHIAQTLAHAYTHLYYVNLDTGEFIEYRPQNEGGSLTEERRGEDFFSVCREEAVRYVYPDDRDAVIRSLERGTLLAALDRGKPFMMTYRLLSRGGPRYMSMRVSRMQDDERCIILGATDVDEQMKQRRAMERMNEERVAYARLNALTGDFLCVFIVVPETGRYRQYSATEGFEAFALPKEGMDFFTATREMCVGLVWPEDLKRFLTVFTREGVLSEIEQNGIFALTYRLLVGGKPLYVQLKAAMVDEKEGHRLIVGINDVDAQIRQEENYAMRLAQAQNEANIDALTGVKNRHAYLAAEERLDRQIKENPHQAFAIVILDVNDLKKVNDTAGHQAGDQYLRDACAIICDIFKHSPVFRVGGDEFAVIAQGKDYAAIDDLIGSMNGHNAEAIRSGGIVVACGMARYENDASVTPVFERADHCMYENKNALKAAAAKRAETDPASN